MLDFSTSTANATEGNLKAVSSHDVVLGSETRRLIEVLSGMLESLRKQNEDSLQAAVSQLEKKFERMLDPIGHDLSVLLDPLTKQPYSNGSRRPSKTDSGRRDLEKGRRHDSVPGGYAIPLEHSDVAIMPSTVVLGSTNDLASTREASLPAETFARMQSRGESQGSLIKSQSHGLKHEGDIDMVKQDLEPLCSKLDDMLATPWTIWSDSHDEDRLDECHTNTADVNGELFVRQTSHDATAPSMETIVNSGLSLLNTTTQQRTWMKWHNKPQSVLVVVKQNDPEVARLMIEMAIWLDSQNITLVLEPKLLRQLRGEQDDTGAGKKKFLKVCWCKGDCACTRLKLPEETLDPPKVQSTSDIRGKLPQDLLDRIRTWTPGQDALERAVDLVICVGGDGTLCWAAGLFSGAMPPVLAFAGGSLGFLTPFPMKDWMLLLNPVLGAMQKEVQPLPIACRMRFQIRAERAAAQYNGNTNQSLSWQALNEVLVHRGSSGSLVKLEVVVNQSPVTMVQGDGLILATPTGSTAYSLAAGGSMMHPSVPGIILTPVCPHSLSFRPVVLPDSAVVTVRVPMSARSSVMVAVDGKDKLELECGDSIQVFVSRFPLPTICKTSVTDDWFHSLNSALQWNLRLEQKAK